MKCFKDIRVLVVGDVILDHYVEGNVSRISPEAPVPILVESNVQYRLGGAANVAANAAALGAQVTLVGCVGVDDDAERLEDECKRLYIKTVFLSNLKHTTRKTRFVAGHQQILRVDREAPIDDLEASIERVEKLNHIGSDFDIIIVSDYAKGVVCPKTMEHLKKSGVPIVVDPKPINAHMYEGVELVTPNLKEAREIVPFAHNYTHDQLASRVRLRVGADTLLTLGPDGMLLACENHLEHIHAVAQDVYDVTGAGDTVVAVVSVALASGRSKSTACHLANRAAALVITKLGTATISMADLGLE